MNETKRYLLKRVVKISVWILLVLSLVAFYISLRTPYYSLEYSLIAMGLWVIVFGLNFWLKRI